MPFGVAAPDLVEKFGPHVLAAAGVLDGFAVVNDSDVLLDPAECDHDLDLEDEWLEAVLDLLPDLDVPPVVREFTAVRDLEYVADWQNALALLSRPPLRAALRPMRVLAAGETVEVPSYTAWWLSRHEVLAGRRPTELRLPTGDPLLFGLYGEAPAGIDDDALKMIGVRSTLADLLDSHGGPEELLDLLADSSLEVDRAQLRSLWIALAAVDPARVSPPEAVRAVLKGTVTVADVEDGPVVVEAPDLLALVEDRPLVLAPFDLAEALSEVLDLPLAGEVVTGAVTSAGTEKPVPPEVRSLLPGAPRRTSSTTSCSWTAGRCRGGSSRAWCTRPAWTAWPGASPGRPASGATASPWRRSCATPPGCPCCSPRPTSTPRPRCSPLPVGSAVGSQRRAGRS